MSKIRVILADRQPSFRAGLCRSLSETSDIEVVAQTGHSKELLELSASLRQDVTVIDAALPGINGIAALKQIDTLLPDSATLVLSEFESPALTLAALRAGAAGFLTKDTPVEDLIGAIRLIQAGEGILERKSAENLIRSQKAAGRTNLELYPRELEVLKSTAKGLRNKEIAMALNISERTVQSHLSNIYSKMAVESRTEAVLKALKAAG
jgi:DNA-binding NarL/FixJ family response regulator